MGGKRAIKLSLRLNWPNVCKASAMWGSLQFICNCVSVVSLKKYLLAS